MSGHSKWASIKHKKAAKDAKRGALFTKLIKDIQVAARLGGSDIIGNPRLKITVQKAKESNMPSDNIERAIKKGAGELEGIIYNEILYEGYGPGGVAFMVSVLTENKNRSAADIRAIFSKNGGNMAEAGSVMYLFDRKGVILVPQGKASEEQLMELVLEAGGDDMTTEDNFYQILTSPENFMSMVSALTEKNIETEEAEVKYLAKSDVQLNEKNGLTCLNLLEKLEEHDDVQNVYSNFDIPDIVMQKISENN